VNRIRYVAASLLCLDGLLHVSGLGMAGLDAAFVTTATVFGIVYLVIGGFLFGNARAAYYLGAIAPLVGIGVGLVSGLAGGPAKVSPWMALLAALDVAIVLVCFSLIRARRRASGSAKAG
jgi:hypothetical protein